jgi:hypothetical protein
VFASMVSYGIETSKGHGDEALRRSASVWKCNVAWHLEAHVP